MNEKKVDLFKYHMDRIRNAPEQNIVREIDSIKWSFKIFHGNYVQLINILKALEDKPESIKLWDVKKKNELYQVFEEIGRLLFNYLAAAFMLIDHTRRYVDKMYMGEKYKSFVSEYKKEVTERFANNDNHQLAKGLRNYIQHRNLPAIGSVITATPETGISKSFRIPVDSLLLWDGWSNVSKEKLKATGDSFVIREFIEEYYKQVEDFHKWIWEKQVKMHKEDYDRLNEMKQEAIQELLEAGVITEKEIEEYLH